MQCFVDTHGSLPLNRHREVDCGGAERRWGREWKEKRKGKPCRNVNKCINLIKKAFLQIQGKVGKEVLGDTCLI